MPAPVRVGLLCPFSGIVGMYGVEIARAAKIACAEINEAGGVAGRPLELVIANDGSLPETSVSAAERLVGEGCIALIGSLLSNARIAVAYRVAEPRRIPLLNFSFYEGSILSRYFFNFAALPNQQIERMIPSMRDRFGPRMYFAGNAYEWPRGSIAAAKRALDRCGGEVVGEEYFPLGSAAPQLEALLDRVAAARADVLVPYFAGSDQAILLRGFHARGLTGRVAVVMGHCDEVMVGALAPEVRAGLYSSNTYFMTVDTPENHRLLARLAASPGVQGTWPRGNGVLTHFGEGAYVCVKAFAAAAAQVQGDRAEALLDALSVVEVDAPQGRVCMRAEIQHARVNSYLARCERDGTFSIIERFGGIEPVLPDRYRHQRIDSHTTLEDELRMQARILSRLSEAVVLVRASDRTIVYNNAAAEQLFGRNPGALVGVSFEPDALPNLPEVIDALTRAGAWQGDLALTRADATRLWCTVTATAFTHPFHGEVWLASCRDVTHQRLAEARLLEAERLALLGAWERDLVSGVAWWSEQQYRINGIEPGSPIPPDMFQRLVHPEDLPAFAAAYDQVFAHGSVAIDYRIVRPDGQVRHIRGIGRLTRDASGQPIRLSGSNQDITASAEAAALIRRSLAEKEALLREIHHRVKNNLAIVSSLIHFQAKKLHSAKDVEALDQLRQRIQAMSLVHDRLYQAQDVARVDFADYVHTLANELCRSSAGVGVDVESDPLFLPIEIAIPAGQILCELIGNAIAHAYPDGQGGRAGVSVRELDSQIVLAVTDVGIGLPASFDLESGSSFGWLLIRSLTKQLDGHVEILARDRGTHVRVRFPARG